MHIRSWVATTFILTVAASVAPARPEALGKPGLNPVPCADLAWEYGDPAFEPRSGAKAFFGRYDGGLYRMEIPESWNGELVLYAHGYVANTGANGLRLRVGPPPIREHLIRNGFAWAASSYRCNGYVPGIGLLDTMALTPLFTTANQGVPPKRVYLTGTSMGGHVTLLGLHEFPEAFAAGLASCPSGPELFDFFTAVGAAAEVVTGIRFTEATLADDVKRMGDLLGTAPDYTEKGRQLASIQVQISGGPRPFAVDGLASRFLGNINGGALAGVRTPTNRAATNTHIKYAISERLGLSAAEVNRRVRRKTADPELRSPKGPYEELVPFDGQIARPLLTLHGTGDMYVPIFLEQTLKRAVVAAGRAQLLTQRVMRIAGHCGFSQLEQTRAFDDLVTWVRDGVKPEGDEVLGDLQNAGLRFTNPLRPNDPGEMRIAARKSSERP